jgi:hypothetical protein
VKRSAHSNPLCPQDAAHGPLLSWPTASSGWFCPHVSHVGGHFYRTDLSHSSPAPSREQDRPSRRSLAGTPSIPASGRLPERLG